MIQLGVFGGVGAALGLIVGAAFGRRAGRLLAVGAALAFAFVVYAYLSSPTSSSESNCSDCGEYLGRWWEPALVVWIASLNFVAYCGGLFAGIVLRRTATTRRAEST